MELILQDTDIYDEEIGNKVAQAYQGCSNELSSDKVYDLKVYFHMGLLSDHRLRTFKSDDRICNETKKVDFKAFEEMVNRLLSIQLKNIDTALLNRGIEVCHLYLIGNKLEARDIILMDIQEKTEKPIYTGTGKNRKMMRCFVTAPDLPYIQDKLYEFLKPGIIEDIMKQIREKMDKQ